MFEVYVHVPFCLRRCGYCDFNTYTAVDLGSGASRSNYANMAIAEMRLVKAWQERHGIVEPPASSVFFGGGTPTVLSAADLGRMLAAIREIWGVEPGAEITTEANPDTIDRMYLDTLKDSGFTRVSMGMQSAVPHVLKTLDRTHTPQNVTDNVEVAKEVGLDVSVDLIYGAPGESLDDWRTSVETALALGVDHVSAYALTVEPTTKMGHQIARGEIARPDDDDEAAKYELADDCFTAAGLDWYEISNWARPGHESRHNLGYWRNVDWAGIGPGAHSHYRTSNVGAWKGLPGARDNGFRKTSAAHDDAVTTSMQQPMPYGEDHEACNVNVGVQTSHGLHDAKQFGIRAWDMSHPRKWADSIHAGLVPWQGSESISHSENLEETVMLGLRLHEGLDIQRIDEASGHILDREKLNSLVDQGLCTIVDDHIVVTRRGRLLNDMVISDILEIYGL